MKVKIQTMLGDIVVRLYDETPIHRDNFVKLVKEGYYDGTLFHLYKNPDAESLLIQPIDEHDLEVLDQEVEAIKELSDKPFSLHLKELE